VDGKKHFPDAEHMEETMRAVIYMLESEGAESDRAGGDGLLCIIFDNEGVGRKNLDTNLFVAKGGVVQVLQVTTLERRAHTAWLIRKRRVRAVSGERWGMSEGSKLVHPLCRLWCLRVER
jgi:hypothetical protein